MNVFLLVSLLTFIGGCVNHPGNQHQILELREELLTTNEALETVKDRLLDVQNDLVKYEEFRSRCACYKGRRSPGGL